MRIFIFGSCVCRDALEFLNDDFKLVKYIARTSLAAQFSEPLVLPEVLNNLTSKFQKNVMSVDMEKSLLKDVASNDFDVLLIDFIDERFGIAEFEGGERLTLCSEFLSARPSDLVYSEINRFESRKFEFWKIGFSKLIREIRLKSSSPLIVINKVYFAKTAGNSIATAVPSHQYNYLELIKNNCYLDQMYNFIHENFPEVVFIDYDKRYLVANLSHKWGVAPFHYIDELYHETCLRLKNAFVSGQTAAALLAVKSQ